MVGNKAFTGVIQNAGGGGAFVEVPFDVEKAFGSKHPKVKATFEGIPYRGSLVRMGGTHHMLIILKRIREKIGKTFGDSVQVTVAEDKEPRVVRIPPDLAAAFKNNKAAQAFFNTLSHTRKREYVNYILEAKREDTRRARLAATMVSLRQRKKAR